VVGVTGRKAKKDQQGERKDGLKVSHITGLRQAKISISRKTLEDFL
jgi:ribosomal protein L20